MRQIAMTIRWYAAALGLTALTLLASGCQSAPTVAVAGALTASAAASATAPTYAPVLSVVATTVHSAAAAREVANESLDLIGYPPGAIRLATRPAEGDTNVNPGSGDTAVVTVPRWYSMPGTVAGVDGWLTTHAPNGLGLATQTANGKDYLQWDIAYVGNPLAFGLAATLTQDGDHVIVSIGSEVFWVLPNSPIETVPARVTSATLDYEGPSDEFGSDSSQTVSAAGIRQLRTAINNSVTMSPGSSDCAESTGEQATLVMRYSGHTVVFTDVGNGCYAIDVTSDGKPQPALVGFGIIGVMSVLGHEPPPVPATPLPARFRGVVYSAKAAQARANALPPLLTLPPGTTSFQPPADSPSWVGPDPYENLLVAAQWSSSPLAPAALIAFVAAHLPSGFGVAYTGSTYDQALELVLQPLNSHPAHVAISVFAQPYRGGTRLQVVGQAVWLPPRSPQELIPLTTAEVELTVGGEDPRNPYLPRRHVFYRGPGVRELAAFFNRSRPWAPGQTGCSADPDTLQLKAIFRIGNRKLHFEWADQGCNDTFVTVNGLDSTTLNGRPTTLVEHLLGVKPPA